MTSYLVADIGGTNARFALAQQHQNGYRLSQLKVFAGVDYPTLTAALEAYSASLDSPLPDHACIAIAGPVAGDKVSLSNMHWEFSISDLQKHFDFKQLQVINDFSAQACSMLLLQTEDLITIKSGQAIDGAAKVILGPGTGLGVAALVPTAQGSYPLASEAGNMPFAPSNAIEAEILQTLWREQAHVSIETLLSGRGLVTIYNALASIQKQPPQAFSPAQVSNNAIDNSEPLCRQALTIFCGILGSAAGSFALAFAGKGGIYLTGGILPRMVDFLRQSEFSQRFCQQGTMSGYVEDIPVYLITHPQPGLMGAAAWLELKASTE